MAFVNFDKYFMNFPEPDRRPDFADFWKDAIAEIKKIPLDHSLEHNQKKSSAKFNAYSLQYRSCFRTTVKGTLMIPVGTEKPGIIISLHDYNEQNTFDQQILDTGCAHLFLTLRGHEFITDKKEADEKSPGYFIENILEKENYYVKAVYLDVLRSIDALRLINEIDCSRIGIRGTGFGGAAAVFAAAFSDRVKALFLDSLYFSYLSLSQNISGGEATAEINEFIAGRKSRKKQIKDNLSYFDALNFCSMITCPALFTTGLKNETAPAECIFALFNRLETEKTMHIFPEDSVEPGGKKEMRESYRWLCETINSKE